MSKKILRALMQLFAIIARPGSNREDRIRVVESFLLEQLNKELVDEYLQVFDKYYKEYQEKHSTKKKMKKAIALGSVKVLRICTEINKELTTQQKFVVLIQLLEFIKADTSQISQQEREFVETVSDTFKISRHEFDLLDIFLLNDIEDIPESPNILLIDSNEESPSQDSKHLFADSLRGQIRVLNINSVNLQIMRFLGENELYLNGQLIQQDKVYVLTNGSSIRSTKVHPIYYSQIVGIFNYDRFKSKVIFEANDIIYHFDQGKIGLHEMSFQEESGHMVGIMGASGAGKSTLLNVLNGNNAPTNGRITLNGFDMHADKGHIEGLVGYVSQDDLLIEELSVFQNLYYNAKLSFGNKTNEDITKLVDETLSSLGLYESRDMRVGSVLNKLISGGQRKRLNIALELIREPSVLFLDEPTSGLSSRDSENIMDLLKELSLKGKLVIVVIHQPSSDIFKMFDRLIILDTGGYMIYNGAPIDAITHFKSTVQQADMNDSVCRCCGNVNPEQVFNIVEAKVLDEFGNFTNTRKKSPLEWNQKYIEVREQNENLRLKPISKYPSLPTVNFTIPNRFAQWKVYITRDVLAKISSKQFLMMNILEVPILALILSYVIKYYSVSETASGHYTLFENDNLPVYLFMSVIVAIFVGLTSSAEEVFKDRKILKREAFLNLSRSSYLLSKVFIMFGVSAVHALVYVLIGNTIMEIYGMYWEYWLVLFSTWAFSNMLGLIISDTLEDTKSIYLTIPFIVIPQILLSGVIVQFDKLNPSITSPTEIPFYGEIITSRWAYEALAVEQFKANRYERELFDYHQIISTTEFKKVRWMQQMENLIGQTKRNLRRENKIDQVAHNLEIIRNELRSAHEKDGRKLFGQLALLTAENVNPAILDNTKAYLKKLREYYVRKTNIAREMLEEKKQELLHAHGDDYLARQQRLHANKSLSEFVKNDEDEYDNVLIYKGEIYQKNNPVFIRPEHPMVKAHFYAPEKRVFGELYNTMAVNVGVIWAMSLLMYIGLYYRTLKGAQAMYKKLKKRAELYTNKRAE